MALRLNLNVGQNTATGLNRLRGKPYAGIANAATGASPVFSTPPVPQSPALPDNYGFNELAGYEEARRNQLGQNFQNQIGQLRTGVQSNYDKALTDYRNTTTARRNALASSLSENARNTFQQNNPFILEDLNSRGLFSSPSEVARAQASELARLELSNQAKLTDFDSSSRTYEDALANERLKALSELDAAGTSANIQAQQDAVDSALDLRRGQLEQRFQGDQASREEALARELAKKERRNQINNSLIGAGGGILGGILSGGGGLFGNLSKRKPTTVGAPYASGSVPGPYAPGEAPPVPGAAGGLRMLPMGLLAAGGIAGYQALPEKGLLSKATIAPLVNPIGTAKNIGSSVSKAAKKVFCFDARAMVAMADGGECPINQLQIGDETKGGTVESIRHSKTPEGTRFLYKGVKVTGSHAVFEDGKWIRVEDSPHASPLRGDGLVWSIVTDKHRVFIDGIQFADEVESDHYESLTIEESLQLLNDLEKSVEVA